MVLKISESYLKKTISSPSVRK